MTLTFIASSFWQEPRFVLGAFHFALRVGAWMGPYLCLSSGARAKGQRQFAGGIALVTRLERKGEKNHLNVYVFMQVFAQRGFERSSWGFGRLFICLTYLIRKKKTGFEILSF